VYIKRAERTGKLDGWKCWVEGEGMSMKAIIEIYRKDQSHPFQHEAYYSEAVQTKYDGNPNRTWSKMPRFMLKKVAIGQGFRLCFPDEMGGMPYEEAEIPIPEEPKERNVTPGNDNHEGYEPLPPDSDQVIEQQCRDAMTEIGTILKTLYKDQSLFTEAEYKKTREACVDIKDKKPEDRLFLITKFLNEKKKQMKQRIELIDTTDLGKDEPIPSQEPSVPSQSATQPKPSNQGSLPAQETNEPEVPAMYTEEELPADEPPEDEVQDTEDFDDDIPWEELDKSVSDAEAVTIGKPGDGFLTKAFYDRIKKNEEAKAVATADELDIF
jgi:hypothetical protein